VVKIDPARLKPLAGKYAVDSDHMAVVSEADGRLFVRVTSGAKAELFPIAGNKFVRKDESGMHRFEADARTGKTVRLTIERNRRERGYERMGDDFSVPLEWLLAGQVDKAMAGYRELYRKDPYDRNIGGMRLLYVVEDLLTKGKIKESMSLLHLVADLHPDLVKKMYATLNNEMRMLMRSPMMPEAVKKQVKDSYNSMLKKLGLKELE
jgi:hypothetical protein